METAPVSRPGAVAAVACALNAVTSDVSAVACVPCAVGFDAGLPLVQWAERGSSCRNDPQAPSSIACVESEEDVIQARWFGASCEEAVRVQLLGGGLRLSHERGESGTPEVSQGF